MVKHSVAEDREYFLKRSLDHCKLAELSEDSAHRALHRRFADLYFAQAEMLIVVEDD